MNISLWRDPSVSGCATLARRGRLAPALHDAFVNDRTTRADDLLARIEDDGLVAALDPAPAVLPQSDRRAS